MSNFSRHLPSQNSSARVRRIVTIGGGTGTFTVLSGLRTLPRVSLTAIVSSADDGGSTGRLRDAYGMLPVGDARQALVALAEEGSLLRGLFAYRFAKGDVAGHNLGNLFLTALAEQLGSAPRAIEAASRILRVKGRILSVSEGPTVLIARLADGTMLTGEHAIDERLVGRAPIEELSLAEPVSASEAAAESVRGAGLIVLGPGDLYTSSIAPLLPRGMREALAASRGRLVYVMNLFSKAGQTEGYGAARHVAEIERYAGRPLDHILIADDHFAAEVLARYRAEGEEPVADDVGADPRVRRASFASVVLVEPVPEDPIPRSLVRHDSAKLAEALAALLT